MISNLLSNTSRHFTFIVYRIWTTTQIVFSVNVKRSITVYTNIPTMLCYVFSFLKAHTIPLLHLAHLLHSHNIIVSIFTAHENSSFIHSLLTHTATTILELPFPQNPKNLPPGVESTDKLPSLSIFLPFVHSTKPFQPHFKQVLLSTLLPRVSCIICDGLLPWAHLSVSKVGVPSLIFFGINTFSMINQRLIVDNGSLKDVRLDEELSSLPFFPNINLYRCVMPHFISLGFWWDWGIIKILLNKIT